VSNTLDAIQKFSLLLLAGIKRTFLGRGMKDELLIVSNIAIFIPKSRQFGLDFLSELRYCAFLLSYLLVQAISTKEIRLWYHWCASIS
jgi:hypothetical protein